jgi:hypothetical protein
MRPDKIHPMPERPMAGESSMVLDAELKGARSLMPSGPQGQKRPADAIGNAIRVALAARPVDLALFEPRHMSLHQFQKVMHFGQ